MKPLNTIPDIVTTHRMRIIIFLKLIYFNWRIITLQYCDGFLPYVNMHRPHEVIFFASDFSYTDSATLFDHQEDLWSHTGTAELAGSLDSG